LVSTYPAKQAKKKAKTAKNSDFINQDRQFFVNLREKSAKSVVIFEYALVLSPPLSLRHGRRCFHCFRWSFFAEKTPMLKIRMDADFKH